jgi:hypothetical protein
MAANKATKRGAAAPQAAARETNERVLTIMVEGADDPKGVADWLWGRYKKGTDNYFAKSGPAYDSRTGAVTYSMHTQFQGADRELVWQRELSDALAMFLDIDVVTARGQAKSKATELNGRLRREKREPTEDEQAILDAAYGPLPLPAGVTLRVEYRVPGSAVAADLPALHAA